VLDVIARAAKAGRHGAEVTMAAGDAPGEVLLYMIARGLSPDDQRELLAQAQEFVRGQDRDEAAADPPGSGLPASEASHAAGA
jgi:hypothetical protein